VPVYKKQLRLPHSEYIGRRAYFVTVCTEDRATYFSDPATGRWLLEKLIATAAGSTFALHAYCAMPDHVHFVCEGLTDTCNLIKFVEGFKQRSAYEFSKTQHHRLWQRRYYDHILRPSDAIEEVACYIWWNPVRKGLCVDPHQYSLSGSQTLDWMKHSSLAPQWQPPWKLVEAGLQPG